MSKKYIVQEYESYYKKLLQTRRAETTEEQLIEEHINEKFHTILTNKDDNRNEEEIIEETVRKAVKLLKNKKAADTFGWKAEWLKEGGMK